MKIMVCPKLRLKFGPKYLETVLKLEKEDEEGKSLLAGLINTGNDISVDIYDWE